MIEQLSLWFPGFALWMLAAAAVGVAVLLHALLKYLHIRLRRLENGRWHLLAVAARAVHPPLVGTIWLYGAASAVYYLVPQTMRWHWTIMTAANVVAVLLGFWLFVRVSRRLIVVIDRWAGARRNHFERYLLPFAARCVAALVPVFVLFSLFPLFILSDALEAALHNLTSLILIASIAGVLIHGVNITERILGERYQIDTADNLVARRVHTQITVMRKLINFVIVVLALASMLMLFQQVRQLGASILASAGILGVVLGFAAQKVIGNLIAGIQIALTQPIQLDDAVIVEGEWGWIEELTLTYVVVRLWDWRRLVLPINWFIDNPFENWTRRSDDLIGSVILYADFSLPLDALNREALRIAENSPLWSGKVCKVQLLEMTEYNMQLRVLVSARGGPATFDMRCEMRSGLIDFIAREYPHALPRMRIDMPTRERLHDSPGPKAQPGIGPETINGPAAE